MGTGKLGRRRRQENGDSLPRDECGEEGCGKRETPQQPSGLGRREALNGSKGVKVPGKFCLAPAAAHRLSQACIFCLFLNEAPKVRPSMLRGTLQHQRAGKEFDTHLQSLLHTQSSLHCLDVKGNQALTGFPETTDS